MTQHDIDPDIARFVDDVVATALRADRRRRWSIVRRLIGFYLCMVVLLSALGFGVGTLEVSIWWALIALGTWAIARTTRTPGRDSV